MTVIIDYGVGNLFSLKSSFERIGERTEVSSDPSTIMSADRLILPGVGAFGDAAEKLRKSTLDRTLKDFVRTGRPIMGICLGMQLLFGRSLEYGEHEGLSLLGGEIRPISERIPSELKIPHIGWNALSFKGEKNELFKYLNEGDFVYFVHSYSAVGCDECIIASTEYGAELTAAVARDNIYGCQFHPEKSGDVGLKILKAFCEIGAEK